MSDNVVTLDLVTRLDIPVERVIQKAADADLKGVVIMGYTKEGAEYFASSYADGGDVLWLAERMKLKLLRIADE